jgi:amino acid adenylation domain-containing protein
MDKKVIHSVFEHTVTAKPANIAIDHAGETITFADLNIFANRLAHLLQKICGFSGRIVNVVVPASIPLVATMLGVFKSGGIFLPVDLTFSEKRLRQIFEETFNEIVVVTPETKDAFMSFLNSVKLNVEHLIIIDGENIRLYTAIDNELEEVFFDEHLTWSENPALSVNGDSSNYIFYTSGSTGDGKAIEGKHAGLSHFIHWEIKEFGVDDTFRFSQLAQITFDASLRDIFMALISGGTLCIPRAKIKNNPLQLLKWLEKSRITMIHCVPSLFRVLTKELQLNKRKSYDLGQLRFMLMAGEILYARDILNWRNAVGNHATLVNLYGPTETTLIKTFYRIPELSGNPSEVLPVGGPISNTIIAIIKDGRICKTNEKGEIYIKTPFMTKGYYKNKALTAESFVPNPLASDAKDIVYKTGDLGRYLPDGTIEVSGRLDTQVKVNGIRVELGEVERALLEVDGIRDAVVKAQKADDNIVSLIAYYTGKRTASGQFREALQRILNPQMIPSYFICLKELPLNLNGKVDRKALPLPEDILMGGKEIELPTGPVEETLAAFWREILGYEKIGRNISFFSIGGNSLRAIQLIARIQREYGVNLRIGDIFTQSSIHELAHLVADSLTNDYNHISQVALRENYALSSSQKRLWVISQFGNASASYNMSGVYVFEGSLNTVALVNALNTLIVRHESLRTVFMEDDQGVRQYILPAREAVCPMTRQDLRNETDPVNKARELVTAAATEIFDLAIGPLVRTGLYQVAGNRWVFTYAMHHIISDGWSMNVLISELLKMYHAFTNGTANPLMPLRIHYKDYAAWQQEQLCGDALKTHKKYWLQQFAEELPVLELPTDYPRPAVKTYNGGVVNHTINSRLTQYLKSLVKEQECTLFMGLLATVNALLYRYTHQQDIIIGTPVAGREHIDLENQIGFYVNTLALRSWFKGTDSFQDLLQQVKKVTLGAYEHQVYPFDDLIEELQLQRDMSRNPLMDVMVVLQDTGLQQQHAAPKSADLGITRFEGDENSTSKFDLNFKFIEAREELLMNVVYNSDLYDRSTVVRLTQHLEQLLEAATAAPDTALQELNYLTAAEREQLLFTFNETGATYPTHETITELFNRQAACTPDNIALVADGISLSYREVNEKANQLAHHLYSIRPLQADDLVGVMIDRSANMIIAVLAILKAGAAYVPIDPEYPQSRIAFMLEDTGLNLLLTESKYRPLLDTYTGVVIDTDLALPELTTSSENPSITIQTQDLAYVIYTSGSTGQPKGVMVSHGALVDYSYGVLDKTNIADCRTFGLVSTLAADLGNTVLYTSLLIGGTLHIYPASALTDPEVVFHADLDCIKIVPSHWKALQSENKLFAPAKCLVFGGEPLTADVLALLRNSDAACEVYNHYGPSETTVGKLIQRIDLTSTDTRIALGKPFCRSGFYIIDAQEQLTGIGIIGEICISGAGLSRGYLNREDLTTSRFVPNPFVPGTLMYKTGDLGRWLPDGKIEFTGRKDDQVKIRGYRIELGEIESTLQQHENIDAAAVIVKTGNDDTRELVAYLVGKKVLQIADIRAHLSQQLPFYMMPAVFIQLTALPLTANGKTDRKKLPDTDGLEVATGVEYTAPRNETEEKLVRIWEEVLGKKEIGIYHDFFELGGHSLKAIRLTTHIHKAFNVKIPLRELFTKTRLEEQAQLVAQAKKNTFVAIQPAPAAADYPLSAAQRRLWVLGQFDEGNIAFNMHRVYVFEGQLNTDALAHAFNSLLARHESLRTIFREDEQSEIRQLVLAAADVNFTIDYRDVRNQPDQVLAEFIHDTASTPFALGAGPLLRAGVFQVANDQWIFAYAMHHIISDGWSMNVLLNELLQGYNKYMLGDLQPLPPLAIQYKDYAVWQQEQLTGLALDTHKEYWLKSFEGELPILKLPLDNIRPAVKTYNGGAVPLNINETVTASIKQLLHTHGATLFMGLVAAVKALLHRYTGQEDIIVGSPMAGRDHIDLENQIGFYINPLALRTRFKGAYSFSELLQQVKQTTLEAYEHQIYPFDELVDELNVQRDMSRSAIFDVMVILQNNESTYVKEQQRLPGLSVSEFKKGTNDASKFDLTFYFGEVGHEITGKIEYNSDLFTVTTAKRIADHFIQLLTAAVNTPMVPVQQIGYLHENEQKQLLQVFNDTDAPMPANKTMMDLFEAQATKTPDSVAVVFEDTTLTYRELKEKTGRLANYLSTIYQIEPDDLVAVKLPRNEMMLVTILAILRAGAGYIPVDPAYPQERVDYILADSQCKALVDEQLLAGFNGQEKQYHQELHPVYSPSHLAYVIYTSGSTGRPKGAMIEHAGMLNHLIAMEEELQLNSDSRIAQTAAYTFDISVWQLLNALIIGGTTVIYNQSSILDPAIFVNKIAEDGITILQVVPSYLKVILDYIEEGNHCDFSQLSSLLVTGEAVNQPVLKRWFDMFPQIPVVNAYGPAEAADDVTLHIMDKAPANNNIPIGKPIRNIRIYILDALGMLCPVGVEGEIHVSGIGVGRAYLNDAERTAKVFKTDPFRPNTLVRMYKTGDLGKWLPDGNLEFISRKDFQVKIRGYRIELGEIEYALSQYAGITDVVVVASEEAAGEKSLAAYFVSYNDLQTEELRSYLASKLPAYMIPSYFIRLPQLPLNENGKVDRKQLPNPASLGLSTGAAYVAPRNTMEEQLVLIWQEILGREQVSVKDNFFEIGGHSLKATRLASRVYKQLNTKLPLKELFTTPVLEDQAVLIQQARKTAYATIDPLPEQPYYELSSAQRRLWILSQFEDGNIAYNMHGVFIFEGILEEEALQYAFDRLVARHEILRTVFRENKQGVLKQWVLSSEASGCRLLFEDLRLETDAEAKARKLVARMTVQPISLSEGPLLHATVYRVTNDKWIFSYVMHHIISDGWSMNVLIHELLQCYNYYISGGTDPLSPLRIHYKDYASWQQEQVETEKLNAHKSYWLQQFEGTLPVLELPTDKPRPAIKTYQGGVVKKLINASISQRLKAITQEQNSTLFMGLLAAVNTLLFRYTNQTDIIIGSPIAGREHPDLENQIGFYLNTLALRTQFEGDNSFCELLQKVRQSTLNAYNHQLYPFDVLVDDLDLERDMSRSALFDVMLVLHNTGDHTSRAQALHELKVSRCDGAGTFISKFDLSFDFVEFGEEIQVTVEYNSDLFHKDTVLRMAGHLTKLLEAITDQPLLPLQQLHYLGREEEQQLLTTFNERTPLAVNNKTVITLFEEQVACTSDNIALVFEDRQLSYQELNERANQFAFFLVAGIDIYANDLIGICLKRNEWMMVVVLGVLKTGAAYVPIDPAYPQDRVDYMMEDSQCKLLIDDDMLNDFINSSNNWPVGNITNNTTTVDLVYVIYTSGSTGKPKGVMVTNDNVAGIAQSWVAAYGLQHITVNLLQMASMSFDVFMGDICRSLLTGGRMILCPDTVKMDPESLYGIMAQHEVSILESPPGVLLPLMDYVYDNKKQIDFLKMLIFGSDTLNISAYKKVHERFGSRMRIVNSYGATEATIDSSYFEQIDGQELFACNATPIGKPFANTHLYILDKHHRLQPLGITGEICIGGTGVALGYLNREELTAQKFVADPFSANGLMYKTGDLGRWLPDGNIEFVGRKDDQVKVRGYRIELKEIESSLLAYPGIDATVVIACANDKGDNELVAYIISKEELNVTALRTSLSKVLPGYMVPIYYVPLEKMPFTPNDKIDRKRLPDHRVMGLSTGMEYIAPGNEIEEKLVAIWQEVLGKEKIGIKDNFFTLGGHSLKLMRVISMISEQFQIKISIESFFNDPYIEKLSKYIQAYASLNENLEETKDELIF